MSGVRKYFCVCHFSHLIILVSLMETTSKQELLVVSEAKALDMVFGKQGKHWNISSVKRPFEQVREQRKWEKRHLWGHCADQGFLFSVKELTWPVTVHKTKINVQSLCERRSEIVFCILKWIWIINEQNANTGQYWTLKLSCNLNFTSSSVGIIVHEQMWRQQVKNSPVYGAVLFSWICHSAK